MNGADEESERPKQYKNQHVYRRASLRAEERDNKLGDPPSLISDPDLLYVCSRDRFHRLDDELRTLSSIGIHVPLLGLM